MSTPVRWSEDLETEQPDEAAETEQTIQTMAHTMAQGFEVHRHGTSATHAKSHGVVTGTLTVLPGLRPEVAQGLFADPATYDVVLRLASEPGVIDDDREKRARGAALKVLDVPGEKLREGWTSQDFLFNTWPVLPQGDVHTYLQAIRQRDEHFGQTNRVRLGTMLHHPRNVETLFDKTPNISPVSHTYYSQSAFRHGDHVAKLALRPTSAEQLALRDTEVGKDDEPSVLRDWTRDYFATREARFELGVQLCTDLDTMPIEDVSVEWPEDQSPYLAVAELIFAPQECFSPARRVFAEDVMSWRPWYGLAAHRPLGSINRLRRTAYERLGGIRHEVNDREERDPRTLADVPD